MELYVTRHGQTQYNLEKRVLGSGTDLALTEKGLAQAREFAEQTQKLRFDVILVSPMLRARQTAQIIAEQHPEAARDGKSFQIEERLTEQNFGIYEGCSLIKDAGPFLSLRRNFAYRLPGGESILDVAGRVYPMLKELPERYPGQNVLLVCHGVICRMIRSYFEPSLDMEYHFFQMENCGLLHYIV